jgi:signal transduction histidine kinase
MSRTGPWFNAFVAGCGLLLYGFAFVHQAELAGLPVGFDAGLVYPLRFDGHVACSPAEARLLAEGHAVGTSLEISDARGHAVRRTLPHGRPWPELLTILISGLLYWMVSTFLLAPRRDRPGIQELTWAIFLFGLSVMIGGVYMPRAPEWPDVGFNLLQIACLAALPVLFISIALRFLRPSPILLRLPWLLPGLGLLAALSGSWQAMAYHRYYALPGPERAEALEAALTVGRGLMVAQVGAGFAILFFRGRHFVLAHEKSLLKWLLWGFAIGLFPYVFLRQLPTLLGLAPPWGSGLDRLFELSIPLIFLFIVARYRFLDIDIIIRRSLIYAVFATGLLAIYLTLGLLIGRRVLSPANGASWIALLLVGMAAGVWFRPLRDRIALWVDRSFFKLSHNYRVGLIELRHRLESASSTEEAAKLIDGFLETSLAPTLHSVVIECRERRCLAGSLEDGSLDACLTALRTGPPIRGTLAPPGTTNLPAVEAAVFPDALTRAGIVVLEPLPAEHLQGWLFLGPKRSGWRYVEVDIRMIQDVAHLAAEVLEKVYWIQAAAEEAMERNRLAELDRMKNDFLSRVAHDLRTPLASIAWSTDNLIDGVDQGDASARTRYLRSIKISASHLSQLVNNLLELSRLEKGAARLELETVSLAEVLDKAVTALLPLAEEKGVRFVVTSGDAPILVRADPGKVLEVALNLFDNALKYSPPGGKVDVVIGRAPGDHASFTVRDHGPGLGALAPAELFERFRQGSPSPHAAEEGFGLGLHVVKTFLELMGGAVSARTHPDGGAEFTASLPLAPVSLPR